MNHRMIRAGLLLLMLVGVTLAGCRAPSRTLQHDAYIWQRVWTPALADAIRTGAPVVNQWRVLAAQFDATGQWQHVKIDWRVLAASQRSVVLVLRIDGQLKQWNEARLLAQTLALWRDSQHHGVVLAGLEIDHDCGTARLPQYAHFLHRLHDALAPQTTLSITALPAWLTAPALRDVLAAIDQSVLQVHAVRDPRAGLFDGVLALHWVRQYAARSDKPFRVALPTYGSRVSWDAQGRLVDVESEADTLDRATDARELLAPPTVIADFLQALKRDPPPHLDGIAWFRLPTVLDRRAWSLATWLAVVRGQSLRSIVRADTTATSTPGTLDVRLENAGDIDVPLPDAVVLPASCKLADGIGSYRLQQDGGKLSLRRQQQGLLRAHRQRIIGWARCPTNTVDLHVDP